ARRGAFEVAFDQMQTRVHKAFNPKARSFTQMVPSSALFEWLSTRIRGSTPPIPPATATTRSVVGKFQRGRAPRPLPPVLRRESNVRVAILSLPPVLRRSSIAIPSETD